MIDNGLALVINIEKISFKVFSIKIKSIVNVFSNEGMRQNAYSGSLSLNVFAVLIIFLWLKLLVMNLMNYD